MPSTRQLRRERDVTFRSIESCGSAVNIYYVETICRLDLLGQTGLRDDGIAPSCNLLTFVERCPAPSCRRVLHALSRWSPCSEGVVCPLRMAGEQCRAPLAARAAAAEAFLEAHATAQPVVGETASGTVAVDAQLLVQVAAAALRLQCGATVASA
jgi:hypothetical protein